LGVVSRKSRALPGFFVGTVFACLIADQNLCAEAPLSADFLAICRKPRQAAGHASR
jgi:hypothetical protein